MGKSSLAISNVGSSTHRKPLSLKPQQSTFKKTTKKVVPLENEQHVSAADKENISKNLIRSELDNGTVKKANGTARGITEESAERLAIRRRIEEAVAAHLASRELETQAPQQPVAVMQTVETPVGQFEPHQATNEAQRVEIASPTSSAKTPEQNTGPSMLRFLSFLMVVSVAIWACLRVAVIEPLPPTVGYNRGNGHLQHVHTIALPSVAEQADYTVFNLPVESTVSNQPVTDINTEDSVGEVVQLADVEDAAPVEEEGDDEIISLDDPVNSSPLSTPVAVPAAPSGSTVVISQAKLASGHVVATVRKLAQFLRPVKEFMANLRGKAGVVVDRLRKKFM